MTTLRIASGRVVDPANGIEDEVRDVWIADGRVIAPPEGPDRRADRTIDARGLVVMPGGVDVHSHLVGSKVNGARLLRPEEARDRPARPRADGFRSGTGGSVPSTFTTGYQYAGLGYTTAVDAAIAPLGARHAHQEFADTPVVDKAFLALVGNNHYLMDRLREQDAGRARDYLAWLLGATGALGVKVVNPGGVERWKQGRREAASLDEPVDGFGVTPRAILEGVAAGVDALGLPHPVHLHGLNLGLPGNADSTAEILRTLDGRRAHLAHIQFLSYGGDPGSVDSMGSQVARLAAIVNAQAGITVDVGQVFFGESTAMTADSAVGQYLHDVTGRKWLSHDIERETGCGVVPITYRDTNFVHALQWAIGLEWFLHVDDPWRVALSTDHPNGASFLSYPHLIALLMDRGLRDDVLRRLPERARARTGLGDLDREYSLAEIAIVTRAGPARMLGLDRKGHLGPGADADVAIYAPDADRERMFSFPRYVLKGGEVLLDGGALRAAPDGATLCARPEYDRAIEADVARWFDEGGSVRFANAVVAPEEMGRRTVVACRPEGGR